MALSKEVNYRCMYMEVGVLGEIKHSRGCKLALLGD